MCHSTAVPGSASLLCYQGIPWSFTGIGFKILYVPLYFVIDLNLLDWSVNNHLAVCLGGHVYLWNAGSGDIRPLLEMESTEDYVSSVSWVADGNFLAVGTSTSEVQV